MKFVRQKNQNLNHVSDFLVAENNIFCFTGRRLIILDKKGNLFEEKSTPSYTYRGVLSPDGSKLLMVSIVNKFAILDLKTMEMTQETIKDFPDNLEGKGAWSMTGDAVFFPIREVSSCVQPHILRRYNVENLNDYSDLLVKQYKIGCILFEPEQKKHLIIAQDDNYDYCLVWYDEKEFTVYPIARYSYQDTLMTAKLLPDKKVVSFLGCEGDVTLFTYQGKRLDVKAREALLNDEDPEIEKLADALGAGPGCLVPNCICRSADGKHIYVGMWEELLVMDAKTHAVLAREKIKGDTVKRIVELEKDVILLATHYSLSCARIYKLVE